MLAAIALTLAVGASACGDDGDSSSSDDTTTTAAEDPGTVAPGTEDPAIATYCSAVQIATESEDPTSQADEIAAIAPAEIADLAQTLADYYADPDNGDIDAAREALFDLAQYNQDVCGIPINFS